MNEQRLIEIIVSKVHAIGSLRTAASNWGVSPTYLSNVMNGKSRPGKSILEALGYERVVMYRKIERRP